MVKNRKKSGFVLLFMLLIVGCGRDKTDVEYVEQAKHYQDAGEMAKAGIELKNALRVNPDNGEARRLLGMLYLTLGNGEGAEKELRKAVDLKVSYQALALPILQSVYMQRDYKRLLQQIKMPEGLDRDSQAEWYVLRGRAQLESGRLQDSRGEFQMAARIAPDSPQTLLGKALDAFYSKKYGSAETVLDAILNKNPSFAEALTLKGDVKRLQSRFSDAEELYTKAISARRNNTADVYKRAWARLELKKIEAAEDDLNQLRVRVPKSAEVAFLGGVLSLVKGNAENAETLLREADRLKSNDPDIQYYLAMALENRSQPQQARAILEALVTRWPDNYRAALRLAVMYLHDKDNAQAVKLLEQYAESKSKDVEYLTVYSDALVKSENYQEALKFLTVLESLNPESLYAKMAMGSALMGMGRYADAVAKFDEAGRISPHNVEVIRARVNALLTLKKWQSAQDVARKWVIDHPGNMQGQLVLAELYVHTKDFDDARQVYGEILRSDKGNADALKGLARLDLASREIESALNRYRELWRTSPGNEDAALMLAAEDVRLSKTDMAIQKLQLAIDAHPDVLRLRIALGQILLQAGQSDQALTLLRPVEQKFGQEPSWLSLMVEVLLARGDAQSAKIYLDRLEELRGNEGEEAYWRAQVYSMTGRQGAVGGELEKAYQLNPGDQRIGLALFRRYVLSGEMQKADELLGMLKKRYSGSNEVTAQEAWYLAKTGKSAEAVSLYKKVYALESSSVLLVGLARAQVASGDINSAIQYLQAGLKKYPDSLPLIRELSEIYTLIGNSNDAVRLIKTYADNGGRDPVLMNNLAWMLRRDDVRAALMYAGLAEQGAPESAGIKDTIGQILIQAGEVDRGLRALSDAVRLSGGELSIRLHYAEALAANGKSAQARNELNQIDAVIQREESEKIIVARQRSAEIRRMIKE